MVQVVNVITINISQKFLSDLYAQVLQCKAILVRNLKLNDRQGVNLLKSSCFTGCLTTWKIMNILDMDKIQKKTQFGCLIKEALFTWKKKKIWDFDVKIYKMHIQIRGLEKIPGWLCVRVCAYVYVFMRDLGKFKLLYLRNYSADRAEIRLHVKQERLFLFYFIFVNPQSQWAWWPMSPIAKVQWSPPGLNMEF